MCCSLPSLSFSSQHTTSPLKILCLLVLSCFTFWCDGCQWFSTELVVSDQWAQHQSVYHTAGTTWYLSWQSQLSGGGSALLLWEMIPEEQFCYVMMECIYICDERGIQGRETFDVKCRQWMGTRFRLFWSLWMVWICLVWIYLINVSP